MKKYGNNILKAGISLRLLSLLLAFLLVGNIVPLALGGTDDTETRQQTFQFSSPDIIEKENGFAALAVNGASEKLLQERAPNLPVKHFRFLIPIDAENVQVDFTSSGSQQVIIPSSQGTIEPGPIAMPLTIPQSRWDYTPDATPMDATIYTDQPFGQRFTYEIGTGIYNGELQKVVYGKILPVISTAVQDKNGDFHGSYIRQATVTLSYTATQTEDTSDDMVDLLILTPNAYVNELQRLIAHKEDLGLKTKLVTLDEIYNEVYFEIEDDNPYQYDEAEQIKFFTYLAKKEWDVTYVMAVGGYRTLLGLDIPDKQFPVRWIPDIREAELGYTTETYYSCLMDEKKELFDSWDTNNNNIYGESQDRFDPHPDVYWGRVACRNRLELRNYIDKVITYETETYDEDWFKSFLTIGGDGFQDIARVYDNNVLWDVSDEPNGDYTIYAQSYTIDDYQSPEALLAGPIDSVSIRIDNTRSSDITFTEDDHLIIEPLTEEQERVYPGKPVAEIVVPSNGDILGNTAVSFNPKEAYTSDFWGWAEASYTPGSQVVIRVKSYDPSPKEDLNIDDQLRLEMSSKTMYKIWVNDSDGNTVFETNPEEWLSRIYYENELSNQLAHDYTSPLGFEPMKYWTSNGNFTGMWDVIDSFSEGHGFVLINGHSSCMSWMDHYPGIPGGRDDGGVAGIASINLRFGLSRYAKAEGDPLFPIDHLKNGNKLPVLLFSGCHSGQFDTSLMRLITDPESALFGDLYNTWAPEGMAWWITRIPQGGSIATIGNSALGYGMFGEQAIDGLGGWLYPEFANVYANEQAEFTGEMFTQALLNFADTRYDVRTFQIMTLLGDPSVKIGGYPPETSQTGVQATRTESIVIDDIEAGRGNVQATITNTDSENLTYIYYTFSVDGYAPFARYFGLQGTFLETFFRGRVMSGGYVTEDLARFSAGETINVGSGPVSGFGHIMVNISVFDQETDELLQWKTEDGFLLGSRVLLYTHPYPLEEEA